MSALWRTAGALIAVASGTAAAGELPARYFRLMEVWLAEVEQRLAAEEQTSDGYWGEHSRAGPTPGYDYLTMTAVALYWEHSKDEAALDRLPQILHLSGRHARRCHQRPQPPVGCQ